MTPDRDGIQGQIATLSARGYCCSQIIVVLALEWQQKVNWDVVRSMTGLKGGLGCSGEICGALTGTVCMMGLYAGHGPAGEQPDLRLDPMVQELVDWFWEEIGSMHGGIACDDITGNGDSGGATDVCQSIILETYVQATTILTANGFDLGRGRVAGLANWPLEGGI